MTGAKLEMANIFIIGSKGIPSKYGGFETFVDKLTFYKKNPLIQYHVSCLADDDKEFYYNRARCFNVKTPKAGPATAVIYDVLALQRVIGYIQEKQLKDCIVYVLACRIGPFFAFYKKKLEALGAKVYVNPDGHEWKRSKWNYWIKRYWKLSERLMVKNADLLICDSKGIQSYIKEDYAKYQPKTTFIAYGADVLSHKADDKVKLTEASSPQAAAERKLSEWYAHSELSKNNYYLIVGRFVPENNYELMIKEFMASKSNKDLVIITNIEQNKFYEDLLRKTNFQKDSRIKFVGTVYDQELLAKIREYSYGYLHGHEVGGTNPSLLEALASTKVNLLLDVVFNKEVGGNGAVYFTKAERNLASLIERADEFNEETIEDLSQKAKTRIMTEYSWDKIVNEYESLFLGEEAQEAQPSMGKVIEMIKAVQ